MSKLKPKVVFTRKNQYSLAKTNFVQFFILNKTLSSNPLKKIKIERTLLSI
jgi:hypothetical protein